MSDLKKKVLADLVFGLLIVAFVLFMYRNEGHSLLHLLLDGFTAAGVLIGGLGGLKFVRNQGAFDVMSYGVSNTLHTTLPFLKSQDRLDDQEESFSDYRKRKSAARKPAWDMLITGGIFLAIALVLLVIYLATES